MANCKKWFKKIIRFILREIWMATLGLTLPWCISHNHQQYTSTNSSEKTKPINVVFVFFVKFGSVYFMANYGDWGREIESEIGVVVRGGVILNSVHMLIGQTLIISWRIPSYPLSTLVLVYMPVCLFLYMMKICFSYG